MNQTGTSFEISGLIKLQWRPGTPSNPLCFDFLTDQYELDQQGYSGIVRVDGVTPGIYNNMIRATLEYLRNVVERIFKRERLSASACAAQRSRLTGTDPEGRITLPKSHHHLCPFPPIILPCRAVRLSASLFGERFFPVRI